jgi:hypothetical protein
MLERESGDFSVDLAKRRVRHLSGAAFVFHTYQTEEDWRSATYVRIEGEHRYRGVIEELAVAAKQAAIAAGMLHY